MAGRRSGRGFTLVELVTVMILIGILAVVALPQLNVAQDFGATSFRDRVAASLRYAQKSAVARRRMVCATVAADGLSLTLTVAASFGAGACANAMNGPDGANPAASAPGSVTLTPAVTLYFQPSGSVTSNAVGTTIANFTLTVTGETPITVTGATGYVN
ncbi:MAG: prepilin-type N-terminal cleavage/methylation domain-containing protein [Gammaproteobacteria bacterium]|nr:prepilin-type N-terminal cleavage/methylation domain-containing protein [Gammaproteobacteria bacterium]MBU1416501.1 prepilin-type N-terminal cleavage/methylation domain-containing protein [Gammaproteobacteria bacterium]